MSHVLDQVTNGTSIRVSPRQQCCIYSFLLSKQLFYWVFERQTKHMLVRHLCVLWADCVRDSMAVWVIWVIFFFFFLIQAVNLWSNLVSCAGQNIIIHNVAKAISEQFISVGIILMSFERHRWDILVYMTSHYILRPPSGVWSNFLTYSRPK